MIYALGLSQNDIAVLKSRNNITQNLCIYMAVQTQQPVWAAKFYTMLCKRGWLFNSIKYTSNLLGNMAFQGKGDIVAAE